MGEILIRGGEDVGDEELAGFRGLVFTALAAYIFLAISILCDDHLCPALAALCARWRVPAALAGPTFVAFGSSNITIIA